MFKTFKNDFPASIVVFFVALPLCLGIALASDAPPLSGLIAGIIGGVIVGTLSGSKIGVSGPAAGLAAIVAVAIAELGSFEAFLLAVVLAGVIQILFGVLRFGVIGYFFPNSVIVGMLTGIGIFIILKQIPHLFGYDAAANGDSTFVALFNMFKSISIGPLIIGAIGLAIIMLWDKVLGPKHKIFKLVQGPIVAVLVCTILKLIFDNTSLEITGSQLVRVPVAESLSEYAGFLSFPDFSYLSNPAIYTVAFTIALVASLETLLSVEATDKLDPEKNITPTNRELFAQGIGNMASGLIGGLPITQVIVRSSANVQSNAKSKMSAIIHGFLLLIAVISIPILLNHIPNAVLASVLIIVGYKLAKPALFKKFWDRGWTQFLPFIITVVVIVGKDLLWGIFTGLTIGIFVVLLKSFQNSMFLHKKESADKHIVKMVLAEEVTFLNKAAVQQALNDIPKDSAIEIDIRKTKYLDYDVIEILEDFSIHAKIKNINIVVKSERGVFENPTSFIDLMKLEKNEAHIAVE
ncbi:SulP family inorganic anion transporter [Paucihalobacter ruber]|uniref:SulP family inorganic anion transporter n=1 Tax=Paucihalobacter ruber TaxID=2567861 RepID=A0A506PMV5_9FLAO|nr:SulP family inorganic anion transporter [Paucihalobacter ruber]TPV35061.1 SulP family inorganic anion transporter [Paucihalobacter ruber]